MNDPVMTGEEHEVAAAVLAVLGIENKYEVMGSDRGPDDGEGRHLALYAPDRTPVCLTVQVHSDLERAVQSLADPYQRGRVPPFMYGDRVGLVIDMAERHIRSVSLEDGGDPPEPPIDSLVWLERALAAPLEEPSFVLGDRESVHEEHFPSLDEEDTESLREVLRAFGAEQAAIHLGATLKGGLTAMAPLGMRAIAIMGEPGSVRRVELYDDLSTASAAVTAPVRFGKLPQLAGSGQAIGYLVTLPGLELYPLGGPDADYGPLELEDIIEGYEPED